MEKRDNIDAEFDKFLLEIDKINMILNGSKKEEEPTEVKIKMNKTLINNRDFITDCMDDRHGETKGINNDDSLPEKVCEFQTLHILGNPKLSIFV